MDPVLTSLIEIAKFTIPALVVLAITYVIINKVMEDHANRLELEIRKQNATMLTPLKLQAYERMILFLERISPQSLINTYNDGANSAKGLRHLMESSVYQEYNHNLSQQIYISNQAWNIIKVVKEEVIQLIHSTSERLDKEATGIELSKAIIDRMIQDNSIPTQKAIDFLKAEINLYF
jgi:hypothetical protein